MRIVNLSCPEFDLWQKPAALFVYSTQPHDPRVAQSVRMRFPELTVVGMSSSHGILLPDEFKRGTFGFLIEEDDNIPLRAVAVDLNGVDNVRQKMSDALSGWAGDTNADNCQFFIHGTQGPETQIINGIQDAFDIPVRIFGATSGHDKFLREGYCFLNDQYITCGVIVIQLLKNAVVDTIACGGYLATPRNGVVTASKGRTILEIDKRPASEVYDEWTDGMFHSYIQRGGTLPPSVGLYPFGRKLESEPECGFWLSHPYAVDKEAKSIDLFAEIPCNSSVHLMRGTATSIVEHVEVSIKDALSLVPANSVRAAILMYCAGCASIIPSCMNSVCELAHKAFGNIPFIGCTTFGEQGRLVNASQNYHGNMMTEIILILE